MRARRFGDDLAWQIISREPIIPVSQQLAAQIRRQQQDRAERFA